MNDLQNNPELQSSLIDTDHIAEGKRAGIHIAVEKGIVSICAMHPELIKENERLERQNGGAFNALDQLEQIIDTNPNAAIQEAKMRELDELAEAREMQEMVQQSRSSVYDANPAPAKDVQIESDAADRGQFMSDSDILAELDFPTPTGVDNALENYLQNIEGQN